MRPSAVLLVLAGASGCTPNVAATDGAGGATSSTTTTSSVGSTSSTSSSTSSGVGGTGCASAPAVDVNLGEQHLTGSIDEADATVTVSCATGLLRAKYFALHQLADGFLTVTTAPTPSGPDLVLVVESQCGVEDSGACSNIALAQHHEVISRWLPKGTYYLIVGGVAGTFDVTVDLSVGDDCSDPIALPYDGDPYTVFGDLSKVTTNSTEGTCGGDSNDVVYRIVPIGIGASATVFPQSAWSAVVSDRVECKDVLSEGDCKASAAPGATAKIPLFLVDDDPRYVIVDSADIAGAYTLTIGN